MSEYFPEPKSLGKVEVELDLSNYAARTNLKNATGINTSSWFVPVPVDLTKLINVVKSYVVKKMYIILR